MTCKHRDCNVSYSANLKEEDSISLADYFSDKDNGKSLADYFLDEEEKDNLGYEFDEEDTPKTSSTTIPGHRQNPGTDFKEDKGHNQNQISTITKQPGPNFLKWQPYMPPGHAFQSVVARSWSSACSQSGSLSQEPTRTQISTISETNNTIKQTPVSI